MSGDDIMVYQHYRTLLSDKEKIIYDKIYTGLKNLEDRIETPHISFDIYNKIINYVSLDNPMFFYFQQYRYQSDGIALELIPNYVYSKEKIIKYLKKISRLTKNFINKKRSDYDFVLYLNTLFKKKIVYHIDNTHEIHTVIGSLINKTAVCDGISKLFKYICDLNNIKAIVVEGDAKSSYDSPNYIPHAWNKVCINGIWSHIDLTYNLTTCKEDDIRHDYCFLTDKEISITHVMKHNDGLVCNDNSLNYYIKRNLVMHKKETLKQYIGEMVRLKQNWIEFKIPASKDLKNVINLVVEVIEEALMEHRVYNRFNVNYNLDQLVFFVKIL